MNTQANSIFRSFNQRITSFEATITRRENVLSFLVIRFVVMSGLVLGFSWTFLHINP